MDKGRGRKRTVLQTIKSMCEAQEMQKDDKYKKLKEIQCDWDRVLRRGRGWGRKEEAGNEGSQGILYVRTGNEIYPKYSRGSDLL